jgi:hypothetical protein
MGSRFSTTSGTGRVALVTNPNEESDYDKRNISVVIWGHRYSVTVNQVIVATVETFEILQGNINNKH